MDQLIEFFNELNGKHIPKNNNEVYYQTGKTPDLLFVGEIDCCDVIDTCCDGYE